MSMLKEANAYIKGNRTKTDDSWRREYHLTPPTGWMNDPNGFVCFKGKYYMFFQCHHFSPLGGVMYWGLCR